MLYINLKVFGVEESEFGIKIGMRALVSCMCARESMQCFTLNACISSCKEPKLEVKIDKCRHTKSHKIHFRYHTYQILGVMGL